MAENYENLIYEVKGQVGLLTLNRPQSLNAINLAMQEELEDFFKSMRFNHDVRVIILSAAGEKGFCGGLDMNEAITNAIGYDVRGFYRSQSRYSRLLLSMRQAPQPIICLVFGAAAGAGFSLALASDIRMVDPTARFSAAYINIGFGGADLGSSYFLPRLIGAGRAYEFLLTGDFMDARTALDLGLVSRIAPREELMPRAMAMAEKMCRKNPLGLMLTKEAINCNLDASGLEQALCLEDRNQAMCFATIRYEGQGVDTRD